MRIAGLQTLVSDSVCCPLPNLPTLLHGVDKHGKAHASPSGPPPPRQGCGCPPGRDKLLWDTQGTRRLNHFWREVLSPGVISQRLRRTLPWRCPRLAMQGNRQEGSPWAGSRLRNLPEEDGEWCSESFMAMGRGPLAPRSCVGISAHVASTPWAVSRPDWHPQPLCFVWVWFKLSTYETEAENRFFIFERCQLVATATDGKPSLSQ